jgi:hypothetical protein
MGSSGEIRLSDLKMDYVPALSFQSLGTFQDFHHIERRNIFGFF